MLQHPDPYLNTILTVLFLFALGQVALLVNVVVKLSRLDTENQDIRRRLDHIEKEVNK